MGITVKSRSVICMSVRGGGFMCIHYHRAPGPPGPLPFLTAPWLLWWWLWASCLWGLGVEVPPLVWGEELLLRLNAGLVPDRPREVCRGLDAERPAERTDMITSHAETAVRPS